MQINESKSNFIIFSRTKEDFTTRLYINDVKLEKLSVIKLLGVWLDEDLSWERNTKESYDEFLYYDVAATSPGGGRRSGSTRRRIVCTFVRVAVSSCM